MIYLLPGMGADRRMYPAPWDELPSSIVLEWAPYFGEQSLSAVAAAIGRRHSFDGETWIVGSSLGGMIALELAKVVPVKGVILIGSARSPSEIGPLLRILTPLLEMTPLAFLQQLARKAPSELIQMFSASDPAFIRAMCRGIFQWEGRTDPALRVHRIHGRHDLVIPLPANADCVLDGGHLIAMTHAQECVDYVRKIITKPL